MNKRITACLISLALAAPAIAAEQYGVAKDAEALVAKAVKHIGAVGQDKAFADFSTPAWIDRDVYLIVQAAPAKVLAHGLNPKLVGKDLSAVKDVDGVPFPSLMVEATRTKGKSWTDYKYTDPVTKKVAPKSAYCELTGQLVVCAGIYKR